MKPLRLSISLLFCFLASISFAQKATIKGTVHTSDGQPAEMVNVGLKSTAKVTQVNGKGEFELSNVEPGKYTLIVFLIGLETKEQEIEVKAGETLLVPDITINETATKLEEAVVSGRKGYKTDEPSSSLRIQTPLLQTPQSILSINKSLIQDQQLFVITDVTRNVSGVTSIYPYVNIYTDLNIRGTRASSNKLRNGMPINAVYGTLQEDMSYVENVEFIKGPAGFMLAQGEPGGMYNVVTKKPLAQNHLSTSFVTGSYGLFRGSVDVGGPIGKKVFYRLNVMGQKSGTQLDYGINDRISIAPVLRYELNDKTALTFEYNMDFAWVNGTFANLPTHDQQFLTRNFAVDDPSMKGVQLANYYGTINLQHTISDHWKITAQIGNMNASQDGDMFYSGTWAGGIDSNNMLHRSYRYMAVKNHITAGQIYLNGNVTTGTINHKILVGFDGGTFDDKWKFGDVSDVLPMDINQPVYGLALGIDTLVDESALIWEWPSRTVWSAISVQDNIQLAKWLQLTLGGRYTYYQYGYLGPMENTGAFSPRAGLLFQPMENTSVYVLYDQAFLPQNGRTYNGERFDPLTGNNIELGIKREWFKKCLFTQLAIYNIIKNNVLTGDPEHPGFSIQRGQIQSKGIEFDAMGSISKNLHIIANYAYTDVKVTKDTDPAVVGQKGKRLYTPRTFG
jgi:iron complex outermembrane recepter protein